VSIPFVDLAAQHAALSGELAAAQAASLCRCDWILGEDVVEFERSFAAACGVAHAIGVDSGTSALELALRACGIGTGDEVVTAANTFMATVLAILHVGAQPVLVDVDVDTATLDHERFQAAITRRTRAVVPVHLYGHPADMDPIVAVARERRLRVIEDACQAHGARYHGRPVGSLGDLGAFSFYPSKNLGALGDGGAVVTDDDELADAVRLLRHYGQREKHRHVVVGYNRRLDTLQAAFLRVKLPRLAGWNERRRAHAGRYEAALADTGVVTPVAAPYAESAWHLYVIRTTDRDDLAQALTAEGIGTGIHYPTPPHLQPALAGLFGPAGSFPATEELAGSILSLPMYPELPVWAPDAVAGAVRRAQRRAQPLLSVR
jgi:dTDP-4-amino-4,6-dideoxygalactose transaminase